MTDRGLVVEWLAIWCLAREMTRSRRTGSPLAVALLTPTLLSEDDPEPSGLFAGAMALKKVVRAADVIAWHDTQILAILPDTSIADAEVAVDRWRAEMWHRSIEVGGTPWTSVVVPNAARFEDAEAVIWEAHRLVGQPAPSPL